MVAAPSELTSLTRSTQEASRVRIEDTLLDGLDDLIDEQTANGEVSYGYDNAGRRSSMTVVGQPAAASYGMG